MSFRRISLAVGAVLALASAAPRNAAAQTMSSNDPAIARIWRLGMDSSRVQWLAQRLLDSIGPRLTATPGMERAQDWMVKMYTSWGIDAKKEQYGTWRGWRRGVSHIDLIAPRVRTLEGTMLGYSPGTGNKPVEAEPVIFHFLPALSVISLQPSGDHMKKLIRATFAAALVCAALAPLSAQQFVRDDPALLRIWQIGMNESKVWDLSQVLMDSIGPRLTGSPSMKAGSDWLIKTYKSWGVDAKAEQYGTWRGWERGHTHVDLVKPRIRTLETMMQSWSPGTGGKDVIGAVVLLPMVKDSAEFLKWLPSVRGKFVLMSAPRVTCRPAENWETNALPITVERKDAAQAAAAAAFNARLNSSGLNRTGRGGGGGPTMTERLDDAGAAGIITSAPTVGWGTYTIFDTRNKTAVGLSMGCEDYNMLYRLADKNQGPTLRVNAESKSLGDQPAYNTIATIKGSEKPNEYVMLSAHFDSWEGGSGATDNGTGTVVMMEAIRILRQVLPNPKRTILVGHWNGEEQGLIGSRAFAADHPEVLKGLAALFNQDNGTGRIQSTSGVGLPDAATAMQDWLSRMPKEFQQQIRFNGIGGPASGGTDNASFDCYGTPGFGLSSLSWDYNAYTHHTNRDTFDKVVFDEVKGNATIVAMLMYMASEDPLFITRERRNLNEPDPLAVGRGGRGGRGGDTTAAAGRGGRLGGGGGGRAGAAGGRGGRGGAAATLGGGRANQPPAAPTTDDKGWPLTCSKGARTFGG